ncbi:neck protein [uncultured Caudovirales phage]|uniref:Neck protein n=1 Tax=uncultured Caudovirales phage TaxID=2100421 RepID=A0A6J5T4Q7_9CAUD|nr:neck protein [uncultured Caudovirales phage]
MLTNNYFNLYNNKTEQHTIEDLICESIKIHGFETFYLPNDNVDARDLFYGEDPVKKFQSAFPIEMYLSNATEYGGDKEFFSKFGLEIKNTAQVIVTKRSFSQRVPQNTFTRPREGDLVFIPFMNGTGELFEITFTNQTKDFMMLGRAVPYFYELTLEKYKYSQEVIDTGVDLIDQVVTDSGFTLHLNTGAGSGDYVMREIVFQSPDGTYANNTTSATVQGWIKATNIVSVSNISGEFVLGQNIIGLTSNANYVYADFDPLDEAIITTEPAIKEIYDNKLITNAADLILDTSETNSFGSL